MLGAGRMGQVHGRNAAANPKLELAYLVDPRPDAAAQLAAELGCRAASLAEALADPALAGVLVATSTDTHLDLVLACLRAGKAVFCEKPLDLELSRLRAHAQTLADPSAPLYVAFNRRFDPHFRALKAKLDGGAIGALETLHLISHDPAPPPPSFIPTSGGLFRDFTIHDFDMARWLLGEEPVAVSAAASCLVDPAIGKAGDFDTLMVILHTASGRQCHINNCRQCAYGYDQRFEVFGSAGMLLNDNLRPSTLRRYGAQETEAREPLLNFFLERYVDAYRIELESFVEAVETGGPMPVTVADGRQALRLADAALESAVSGQRVRV